MSEKQGPKFKPKQEYPSNSISSRGGAEIKPSLLSILIRGFIPNIDNLTPRGILSDIILPYMKDAAFNSISSLMYGNGAIPRTSGVSVNNRTPYDRISTNNATQNNQNTQQKPVKQTRRDYRDIVLRPLPGETAADVRTRGEDIIMDLRNQVDTYGRVSMVYMFGLLDITRDDPQENCFGWDRRNIAQATVVSTGENGCYRLFLPPVVDISA